MLILNFIYISELNRAKKALQDVKQRSLAVTKEYEDLLERHNSLLV